MGSRGAATAGMSLTGSLTRAARSVAARADQVLAKEGLTLDQWLVLDALSGKGGLSMADLADRTLTTGPTLTRVVDKLVTTAQAYREVDVADRRRVLVHLSARGRTTHRRVASKVADVEARLGVPDEVLVVLRSLGG
ncbi:MarR family winged helix-turn-helix transcriptional regulator [Amycolatopsis sp. lyj-112]|uniref:MarR family winged helix-turn-helix transcriptional regulator n=1 Tax=Amycolatopsis sp. lyj-112 TaxID=2789288 RepID=UPI00397B67C1